jgi:hypothetical protein
MEKRSGVSDPGRHENNKIESARTFRSALRDSGPRMSERGFDVVVLGSGTAGQEAAGRLAQATIAVVGEVPLDRLAHAVPAFPTRSEVWSALMAELGF